MNVKDKHDAVDSARTLVLVGGGHTHCLVLLKLAGEPLLRNTRVVLVSLGTHAYYSGMIPAAVAKCVARFPLPTPPQQSVFID